jgi:hypothetical protein
LETFVITNKPSSGFDPDSVTIEPITP